MPGQYTLDEVAQHDSAKSCWVIIKNKVYDVTDFLPAHPGGSRIILRYAGRDATDAFEPIHPPDTLEKHLPPEKFLGYLDASAIKGLGDARQTKAKTEDELRVDYEQARKPSIKRILDLQEMENIARKVLPKKVLAYYSSASDDEVSHHENERAFSRFFFHPRVMRVLSGADPSTNILGHKSSIPIFISSAGLARLGHPDGEANLTRGAGRTGIIQVVSSNASLSYAQIAAARVHPEQTLFFQLYKNRDDARAEERLREVISLGYKAVFLTVDAPFQGNRERDVRAGWEAEDVERLARADQHVESSKEMPRRNELEEIEEDVDTRGTSGALIANDDVNMTWKKTIPWLRKVTNLPIVIKGIQSVDDAILAAEAGADGILLSNHGGRQLEYALPPLEVLYMIRKQRPDIFERLEVYIEGGVKRGTDVLKALCLGAKAVGLGRQFLYAQSAYGTAGVVKIIRILEREILSGMRSLGARTVHDLTPEMVEKVDWEPVMPKL